ncbi:serine acetyltransferase [Auraticoccus sp. F435]|uniref:Serine acetyltransferase n=1 Tax=Auraticoccus cholistanensis TaxID=2656650 RepID=A0A6A9URC9_9ACTN|nr:serine acetyltransferase [Auraticoccus cholistanensis]MVA75303.1 serine acetyltransferase [Auraticoccus cholistanensis]
MSTDTAPVRLTTLLREDLRANAGQLKGQLIVVAYRLAHAARTPVDRPPRPWAVPVGVLYRLLVEWFLGVEIPWRTRIGRRLRVLHGVGIVVNDGAVLGDDVVLRQNVTIGNKRGGLPCPRIGDGVRLGASAIVIGEVEIGAGAQVGAGAVVTRDVPAGAVAVGNPARVRIPAARAD